MERYFMDTSAILGILAGGRDGLDIYHFVKKQKIYTSILCYCEVLNKAEGKRQEHAKELLSSFILLPLTLTDGFLAEKLQYACRKTGKHVSTSDCLIAATALNHDAEVVTMDSDFKRIEGLKSYVF